MTFQQDFASRMRSARNEAGFTQGELAQRIGRTHSCVSQYETAKRMPDLETAAAIACVLRVSMGYLVPQWDPGELVADENQTDIFDILKG